MDLRKKSVIYWCLLLFFPCLIVSSDSGSEHSRENANQGSNQWFELEDMNSNVHDLEQLIRQGYKIALIFWQPWCAPCKREAPSLVQAAETHAEKIKFFGVISGRDDDVDDLKVKRFVKRFGIPYPQIRDRDLLITKQYKVTGTPTIIVLGSQKSVLYRGHRAPNWTRFHEKINIQKTEAVKF